jgi:hypothetical protein
MVTPPLRLLRIWHETVQPDCDTPSTVLVTTRLRYKVGTWAHGTIIVPHTTQRGAVHECL